MRAYRSRLKCSATLAFTPANRFGLRRAQKLSSQAPLLGRETAGQARNSAGGGGGVGGGARKKEEDNTPSDVYEIAVFGVSVLIRRRAQWGATTDVPYVHIEDQNDGPGLLLVEVNNGGESEHPRQLPHGASS